MLCHCDKPLTLVYNYLVNDTIRQVSAEFQSHHDKQKIQYVHHILDICLA